MPEEVLYAGLGELPSADIFVHSPSQRRQAELQDSEFRAQRGLCRGLKGDLGQATAVVRAERDGANATAQFT